MSARILVAEPIAESGVEMLREHFDVDVESDALGQIGLYDGILIRSATKLTGAVIENAERLRVIGRAGIGVDNVDLEAATRRGIVVVNAPQSNVIAAAEHTLALMLALARNIPQAHRSLTGGRWERSRFGGVELYEKTLGVLGFGRIGQLVAARARAFGMRVIAYDPFVSAERFRELGTERTESLDELYGVADFITVHLPNTPETKGFLGASAFAAMREGVRVINCARGGLVDDRALRDALDSGHVAGAALDVFPSEPITDHPLFDGYENVVVTPHLGASTAEAQDRAGVQTAEQVIAALTGGVVSTAVNVPAVGAEDMDVLGPLVPLTVRLGGLAAALASGIERVELEYFGRVAERDTRLLTLAALEGVLSGRVEEEVNVVNAATLAEQRGISVSERKESDARDFTDLVRVTVIAGEERNRVVGTTLGRHHRPTLTEAWGHRFNLELDEGTNLALLRYNDRPGMIGTIGSELGRRGFNIESAAVGRPLEGEGVAVMVVTTDSPVGRDVVDEIAGGEGFLAGRAVAF